MSDQVSAATNRRTFVKQAGIAMLATGMESGMEASYVRLDELIQEPVTAGSR